MKRLKLYSWQKAILKNKIRKFFSNFKKQDTYTKKQIIKKIIKVYSYSGMTNLGSTLVTEITGEKAVGRELPSVMKTESVEEILNTLQKDCNINIKWWWEENKSKWNL